MPTVEKILILPLIIIFLFVMTLMFLNHLAPYIYYTKISDIARQHIAAIQDSGGLTTVEKNKILAELQARGIPSDKVNINAVPALDSPVPYGSPVRITITFNYMMEDISTTNNGRIFSFSKSERALPIVIGKTGISSLIQE